MSTNINQVSLLDYLTPALKNDQFFYCLALALDPLLADIRSQIQNNNILARLSSQSDATLDYLANYHFNLDTYDSNYSHGVKLNLVENAIINKIRKGTPSAVKSVLSMAFSYAEIVEWWQDDPTGTTVEPNTFRIVISDPLSDPNKVNAMKLSILKMKNARSYFAGISSFVTLPSAMVYITLVVGQYDYTVQPYKQTVL
jgi:phage tail P2-like protein